MELNIAAESIGNWFSLEDLSQLFKVSNRTWQRYIKNGELGAVWIGGRYMISEESLKRFLSSRTGGSVNRGPKPKRKKKL